MNTRIYFFLRKDALKIAPGLRFMADLLRYCPVSFNLSGEQFGSVLREI